MAFGEHIKEPNVTEDEIKKFTKELNVTEDEIKIFTQAFRDEKFRGLFFDYARELSDPNKKKIYEEEIKQLEQGKGNDVHFVHVEPFRVLRTNLNGSQKCFINICSSEEIGKPEFKVTEDGRRGPALVWSLPHSLVPGRQERDPKGNKFMIYDVVFHPDSIHLANKDKRCMTQVDNTAIQGIQDAFKVTLDENNVRVLNTKYKGIPHPSMIRKPISGFIPEEPATQSDPLAFPYPENPPAMTPIYTLKYRSFVDLQDFRCSRDSSQSPRPKEIVVTVDVPLLKSARDANLEIKNKTLLLESNKPAYRLELPLAYPVDEDKGYAKFNKQKGQLTITLPVLPSRETVSFCQTDSDCKRDEEEFEAEVSGVEDKWKEKQKECEKDEDKGEQGELVEGKGREREICDQAVQYKDACCTVFQGDGTVHHIGLSAEEAITVDNENIPALYNEKHYYSELNAHVKTSTSMKEETVVTAENDYSNEKLNKVDTQALHVNAHVTTSEINEKKDEDTVKREHEEIVESKEKDGKICVQAAQYKDACGTVCQGDGTVHDIGLSAEDGITVDYESIPAPCNGTDYYSETIAHMKTSEIKEDAQALLVNQTPSETTQMALAVSAMALVPDHSDQTKGGSMSLGTEDVTEIPAEENEIDEDDLLPLEQTSPSPDCQRKPPPALLRETKIEDGEETVIDNHSATITFQNDLLYELD